MSVWLDVWLRIRTVVVQTVRSARKTLADPVLAITKLTDRTAWASSRIELEAAVTLN